VAAAPRAAATAPNLKIKSIMAMPFFHPPGLAGPPSKIVFPLMLLDSGTSMVVDIFGFKNERSLKDIYYKGYI
jgi:hypothetical protein